MRAGLMFVAVLVTVSSTVPAHAQNIQNIIGGLINSAMQGNNQAEWRKLPELKRQCLLAASQSNIRFQQALQQGAISPLDPRVAPLRAKCDEIVDRPTRTNFECTFQQPGQSITTYCDEFYARKGQDGSLVKLSIEEVIQLAASGQPIAAAQFERQDALARRGQMATAGIVASKVVSPSFNCANAKTRSEQAICSSYQLSELDSRYGEYFAKSRSFDRKGELRKQLTPLNKRRQECQSNTGCIKEQLEAGIDKIAAVLAQNGVTAPTIAELDKVKAAEVEQARKVIAEREQAAHEAARIARETKEAQEKAKREDDDRRLAIARAEAEKAKAEREKAQALAQIEIEKAKVAAQVEAGKAKAKAAADAAQAKAEIDQRKAQAQAEKVKAEAESARFAKEEEQRKNSWSGKISSLFGEDPKHQQKIAAEAEKKKLATYLAEKSDLDICDRALSSDRRTWDNLSVGYPSPVFEANLRGLTVDRCNDLIAAEAERAAARAFAEAKERAAAEDNDRKKEERKRADAEAALRHGPFVVGEKTVKVSGVGLGDNSSSCEKNGVSAKTTEVGNSDQGSTGIMTLCTIIKTEWDITTVLFDSTGTHVVSVSRDLYFGKDTGFENLFGDIENFYGRPQLSYKMSNPRFIGYGNAFLVRPMRGPPDGSLGYYNIDVHRLSSGRGLSVQVWPCYVPGITCPKGAYYNVTFHLVDGAEYERASNQGRRALVERRKQR